MLDAPPIEEEDNDAVNLRQPSPASSLSSATGSPPQNAYDPDPANEAAGLPPSIPILVLPPSTPKDLASILHRFTSEVGHWSIDQEKTATNNAVAMEARERDLATDRAVLAKETAHVAEWSGVVDAREKLLATKATQVETERAALATKVKELADKEAQLEAEAQRITATKTGSEATIRDLTTELDKERALRIAADANLAHERSLRDSEATKAKAELAGVEAVKTYWQNMYEELKKGQGPGQGVVVGVEAEAEL